MRMDMKLIRHISEYLGKQSSKPEMDLSFKAYANIFSNTVYHRLDTEVVPALMEMCKNLNISLVLEDMGIDSSSSNMIRMSQEIIEIFKKEKIDYSDFDGLDDYGDDKVFLIALVKVNNWAESLFGKVRLEDLAKKVLDDLSIQEIDDIKAIAFKKISFLGDSGMITNHWATHAGYPDIIAEVFRLLGMGTIVLNKGIGGNKTNQGLARLESDILTDQPDVCYFAFGGNDSAFKEDKNDFVIPLAEFDSNLRQISQLLKDRNIIPVIGLPSKKTKYHTELSDYLKFLSIAKKVSEDMNLDSYDLFNCFEDNEINHYISEDGIHMNTNGQLIKAKVVLKHLCSMK